MKNHYDLMEFVSKQNYTTFIEIGVFEGKGLICLTNLLIRNNKNKFGVYGVDLFEKTTDLPVINKYGKERISLMYKRCMENLKKDKMNHIVKLIKMDSVKASLKFKNRSIDFVYIDASHKYEDILRDIRAWHPKIIDGGIIAGHDYTWDGVEKAVKEYYGTMYQLTEDKELWYYKI